MNAPRPVPFLFESNDLPEFGEMFQGPWEFTQDQLQPGRPKLWARGVSIGTDVIYDERISHTRSTRGHLLDGAMMLAILDGPARAGIFWGRSCPESAMVLARGNREIDVTLPDWSCAMLVVREDEFRQCWLRASGTEPAMLGGGNFLHLPPPVLARMQAEWRRLATGATPIPPGFSLCRAVAEALAFAVPDAGASRSPGPARSRIVREAIGMFEESDYELSFGEVAERLGLNQRTLRNWFRTHTSQSPTQFLLRHRLNRVHRDLFAADPARRSVTEIAMHHGFYELGRFAGRFRQLFGDRPSDVLKRPPLTRAMQVRIGAAASCFG